MQLKNVYLITLLFLAVLSKAYAQDGDPGPGTVTVFSEDGDKFTLFLNGDQKNANPSSRVVVSNVTEVPVSFRIVMEGGAEIKKNGIRQGTNCLYAVQKNKKGEQVLKMKGCSNDPVAATEASSPTIDNTPTQPAQPATPTSTPDQLSARYADGVITINDGRTFTVKKVKDNGMSYPRLFMTKPENAQVTITYDDNDEKYSAKTPLKYEVKDFSNNNAYFTLTVDEGGPKKTWSVKLQNTNGYDLRIE